MVCRALGAAVCLVCLIGCDPQAEHYHDALEGLGNRDFPAAAEGFARLAEQGHAASQFRLGLLYLYGLGVAKNPQQAAEWLARAAEQNEVGAQFYLANLHLKGLEVPQDSAAAFQGFQRLAMRGYVPAQYLLGVMYEKGVGIARNDAEAARWMLAAAEQGHREAIARLVDAYREGRLGLSKDPDRVSYWENRARNRGTFD